MRRLIATLLFTLLTLATSFAALAEAEQSQERIPNIFEDPLLHVGFAWKDIGSWTEQAAKDVKGELDEVDLGDAGKWLDQAGKDIGAWTQQAAKDVKGELDRVDLGDAGKWMDQAGKDIGSWTQQALKDIRAETDKINMTGANEWIHGAARDIEKAIDGMNSDGFSGWLKNATKDIGIQTALEDLQFFKLENFPTEAAQYIRDNPGQTLFYIFEGVAFIAPGVVYGPILGALGFGAGGVRATSVAANAQKAFGGAVPAASWFARVTSAGAGGYGAGLFDGLTRIGTVVAGAVKVGIDRAENVTAGRPKL